MPTMIVENGSGVTGANSYLTVEDADAYHELVGNSDWAGSYFAKEAALIKATVAVERMYGRYFLGTIMSPVQALLFPRYGFYDNYNRYVAEKTIPAALQHATAELALMVLNGQNVFPDYNPEANIKKSVTQVGSLKTEIEYAGMQPASKFEGFRPVDLAIYPVIKDSKSGSFRLAV